MRRYYRPKMGITRSYSSWAVFIALCFLLGTMVHAYIEITGVVN